MIAHHPSKPTCKEMGITNGTLIVDWRSNCRCALWNDASVPQKKHLRNKSNDEIKPSHDEKISQIRNIQESLRKTRRLFCAFYIDFHIFFNSFCFIIVKVWWERRGCEGMFDNQWLKQHTRKPGKKYIKSGEEERRKKCLSGKKQLLLLCFWPIW